MLDLLNRFPDADPLILKLRFLDGLTQQEIGAVLGKSKGQISKDLKRLEVELSENRSIVSLKQMEQKEAYEACLELLELPTFSKELGEWLKETYSDTEQKGDEQ